jgi:NADH dehydrogenase [ubiquinone] 1 alpha subcomplex assembly factor 1
MGDEDRKWLVEKTVEPTPLRRNILLRWPRCLLLALLLGLHGELFAAETVLVDLQARDASRQWQAVNDGVMGGLSKGQSMVDANGVLVFSGTLSLANNGGFASIRCKSAADAFKAGDAIVIRAKGDGREYLFNLYTRTRRMAFSYRAALVVPAEEWADLVVPLTECVPTSFGRRVQGMGPVDPSQISGIGFMLADKKPGAFRLEVQSIKVRSED